MLSPEFIVEAALDQRTGDPFARAVLATWIRGDRDCALALLAEAATRAMVRSINEAEQANGLSTALLLVAAAVELTAADLSGDDRRAAQAQRWGEAHLDVLGHKPPRARAA